MSEISEEYLEARLVEGMYAHGAAECERFASLISKEAGDLFSRGEDELALYLRDHLLPIVNHREAELRKKLQEVIEEGKK